MKVDIYFGRFGASFQCCKCGAGLEGNPLVHPTERGVLFKKASKCEFAGRSFNHPFRGVTVAKSGATQYWLSQQLLSEARAQEGKQMTKEEVAEQNMPVITYGESKPAFLKRVLGQLRYELETRYAREGK